MNLSERDLLYNWHPYTQHKTAQFHPAIVKGKDALLWDENDKEYIDANKSAGDACYASVKQRHQQNGDAPQSFKIGPKLGALGRHGVNLRASSAGSYW